MSGFLHSSVAFWLDLALLVAALGLVAERVYVLAAPFHPRAASPFKEQIRKLVQSGNVDRALRFTAASTDVPLARVVRAWLSSAGKGEQAQAASVDAALLELTPELTARLSWLWGLANAAVAVAVAGVVVRIADAMRAAGALLPEQKQSAVTDAVSASIGPLAAGVGIALVCVGAHALLTAQAKRTLEGLERYVHELEGQLGRPGAPAAAVERPA
jgi:biopolymer transport protein ExbB